MPYLGNVNAEDVSVLLSHSGNTKECVEVAEYLKMGNIPVLAIVGKHGMVHVMCNLIIMDYRLKGLEISGA